jgi:SulP family sulfate permease
MNELNDLTDLAEQRFTSVRDKLRANLIPPLFKSLRSYDRALLRADLWAGLTIAAVAIPQCIAFALLIGVPVPAVVASAIVGTVLCSLFCSSRHLVVGPTNTISIILASALLTLAAEPLAPLQKVLLIGFLMGAIQLAAGLSGLGKITQFVSRSVIVGYTTAVGILIAVGQLGSLLGIARAPDVSLPGTLRHLVTSFFTLNLNHVTAITGLVALFLILTLRRWRPRWPDGLPVLLLAGGASYIFNLHNYGVAVVGDLGAISGGIPLFSGFPLNADTARLIPEITSIAVAAAILGMLESVTVAKSLAAKTGQPIDPNQELIGMGVGNLVGSGFGATPGSASFLRSAANLQSGGRTQWSVVASGVFVLLIVVAISPVLAYIPIAAIAAYLVVIAVRLFQPSQIFLVRHSTSADAAVFWISLIAALFLKLDTAIFVGIGVSLVFFLQKASAPALTEHAFNDVGQLAEIDSPAERNNAQISIVHVEGDLFFGAADIFQDGVRRLAADPNIRVFILRMKNARHLDATTVMALDQLHDYLKSENRHLLISGVHGDVALVLKRSGLAARIGLENMFPAEENPTLATKKALQRAQQLLPNQKPAVRIFYSKPQKGSA